MMRQWIAFAMMVPLMACLAVAMAHAFRDLWKHSSWIDRLWYVAFVPFAIGFVMLSCR